MKISKSKTKLKLKNYSISRNFEDQYTAGNKIFENSKYTYATNSTTESGVVYLNKERVAEFFKKKSFYNMFLQPRIIGAPLYKEFANDKTGVFKVALKEKVGWRTIKEPDGILYNNTNKTLYIIEVKYQSTKGTTHEKLGAANYIKFFYERAAEKLNAEAIRQNVDVRIDKVVIVYIVNKWLYDNYLDDFEYLDSEGISYFIEKYPPLSFFGL